MVTGTIGREALLRLYVEEGLSAQKIGDQVGRTKSYVVDLLHRYDIPTRSKSEAAKLRRHSDETRRKMSMQRKGRPGTKGWTWTEERHKRHKELWADPSFRARAIPKRSGENSPLWRGGTSDPSNVHLARTDWIRVRNECYIRDNGICQDCGVKCLSREEAKRRGLEGRRIQAHHIVSRRNGGSDDLDNLMTLCVSCHHKPERHKELI